MTEFKLKHRLYFNVETRVYRVEEISSKADRRLSANEISVVFDVEFEGLSALEVFPKQYGKPIIDCLNAAINNGWTINEFRLINSMASHFDYETVRFIINQMAEKEPPYSTHADSIEKFLYFVKREMRNYAVDIAISTIEKSVDEKIKTWKEAEF